MNRRYCINCGADISDQPSHHYLCYSCWRESNSYSRNYDTRENNIDYYYDDDSYINRNSRDYNETYYERYRGDSEYDLGPDWDYDEFPPENL